MALISRKELTALRTEAVQELIKVRYINLKHLKLEDNTFEQLAPIIDRHNRIAAFHRLSTIYYLFEEIDENRIKLEGIFDKLEDQGYLPALEVRRFYLNPDDHNESVKGLTLSLEWD